MQNECFSAPNMSEFEDLQTFLKKRQEKKRLEKERKRQPLISAFFKTIKKEDLGYEADDENSFRPNIVTPTPLKGVDTSSLQENTSCKPYRSLTSGSDEVFGSGPTLSAFAEVGSNSNCEARRSTGDVQSVTCANHPESTSNDTATNITNIDNVERKSHPEVGNGSILTIQPSSITGSEHDMLNEINGPRKYTDQKCQTDIVPTVLQKVQTDSISLAVKEVQTDPIEREDTGAQTDIHTSTNQEVQTDIDASNIEEVDEIQVIKSVHSQPTQTDIEEILSLQPITPKHIAEGIVSFNLKSPEPINDADSTISSCSKSEDYMHKPVSAGLDMRRGEYKELEFPPVTTSSQIIPKFAPPIKERAPSPMDLCVAPKISVPNTANSSSNTPSATATMTRHPLADIPKVKMSSIVEKKIAPAHQPQLKPISESTHMFGPSAIMSATTAFIGHTPRSVGRPSRVTDLSVKPMKKVGSNVSSDENTKQPEEDMKTFGAKQIHKLHSFSDVYSRSSSPEAETTIVQSKTKICSSVEPSNAATEKNITPNRTTNMDGQISWVPASAASGIKQSVISKVKAADYISVREAVTPKRVIGLKFGKSISRGSSFRRTLGIGRGDLNRFPLSNSCDRVSMNSTVALPRLREEKKMSNLDMNKSATTTRKRSHEQMDEGSTDDTPQNKKTTVIHDKTSTVVKTKTEVANAKQEGSIKEPMKLPEPFEDDDESTLSFKQLNNAQNTSSDSVAHSHMDDSKDSTYEPSKSTATTSSSEPMNEEFTDEGNNADNLSDGSDDEDVPSEHDVTQESNTSVHSDSMNLKKGDVHKENGQEITTIQVPSSAVLSPKSRQRRIQEYSQVIGKKGVKFSFSGGLPSIKCLLPQKQSDMRGFKDMKMETLDSNSQQLNKLVENEVPLQRMNSNPKSNIQLPSSPAAKEDKPQANSTPKTKKYIILQQTEPQNEEIITNEQMDEPMADLSHPSSEPPENLPDDQITEEDNTENKSLEMAHSSDSAKLNASAENQDDSGSTSDETNAPPSNEDLIPDKEFDILYKGMYILIFHYLTYYLNNAFRCFIT